MKLNILPASAGLRWVREGIALFMRQPFALALLFLLMMLGLSLIASLPAVGQLAALLLAPAVSAGMMHAAELAQQGQRPRPVHLLAPLRQTPGQTRAMLALGGIYATAMLLLSLLGAQFDDGQWQQLMKQYDGKLTPELAKDPRLQAAAMSSLRHMLISIGLSLPATLLFWHAPALVHWRGVPVAKALFFSVVGVARNAGAYALFALGWTLVAAATMLPLMLLTGLMGSLALGAGLVTGLGMLVAAAISTSMWLTFQDSFSVPEDHQNQ